MKRKYRRRLAIFILTVMLSAMSPLWKLLVVLQCVVNLVIKFDEFDYMWTHGGARKRNVPIRK